MRSNGWPPAWRSSPEPSCSETWAAVYAAACRFPELARQWRGGVIRTLYGRRRSACRGRPPRDAQLDRGPGLDLRPAGGRRAGHLCRRRWLACMASNGKHPAEAARRIHRYHLASLPDSSSAPTLAQRRGRGTLVLALPGNWPSDRAPRRLEDRILQVAAELPQLRVEALLESGSQIRDARRPARARLRPDLPLHHQHVMVPPQGEQLVMGQQ